VAAGPDGARSVRDLRRALSLLEGPDGLDPYAVARPAAPPGGDPDRRLRVGWTVDAFGPIDAEVAARVEAAAAALADAGLDVDRSSFPGSPTTTAPSSPRRVLGAVPPLGSLVIDAGVGDAYEDADWLRSARILAALALRSKARPVRGYGGRLGDPRARSCDISRTSFCPASKAGTGKE
jgi:Asp-tRNA(Asn)/Glu-tRNA(Gln) amidotransferase A subunit family amidase